MLDAAKLKHVRWYTGREIIVHYDQTGCIRKLLEVFYLFNSFTPMLLCTLSHAGWNGCASLLNCTNSPDGFRFSRVHRFWTILKLSGKPDKLHMLLPSFGVSSLFFLNKVLNCSNKTFSSQRLKLYSLSVIHTGFYICFWVPNPAKVAKALYTSFIKTNKQKTVHM